MKETLDFLEALWTNEPYICIIGAYIICMLLQAGISGVAMVKRKPVLVSDYGYNEGQIALFYWKSVLLFPVTWFIFVYTAIHAVVSKIFGIISYGFVKIRTAIRER